MNSFKKGLIILTHVICMAIGYRMAPSRSESTVKAVAVSSDSTAASRNTTRAARRIINRSIAPSGNVIEHIEEEVTEQESLRMERERRQALETIQRYEQKSGRWFAGVGINADLRPRGIVGVLGENQGATVMSDGNKDHAVFYMVGWSL